MRASRTAAPRERERGKPPSKAVRIARTPVGLGVFAGRRYRYQEIVGEIGGCVVDDAAYSSSYCMDMGDSRCLEPSSPFRYVNHSCEPNCRFDWFDLASGEEGVSRRRVFLLASTEIEPGEELTIDYGWPATMAIRCRCQAPTCRGWIVSAEELPKVVASS